MANPVIVITLATAALAVFDYCTQPEFTTPIIDSYSPFARELVVMDQDIASEILGMNMSPEDANYLEEFINRTPRTKGTIDDVRANSLSLCYGNTLRGSGFLLGPEGYFISAKHVFEEPGDIPNRAISRLGESFEIEQTVLMGSYDLIIRKLRTDAPIDCENLALSFYYSKKSPAFMMPSHLHPFPAVSKGRINGFLATNINSGFLQLEIIAKGGHSGSPVFDQYGNILGVLYCAPAEGWKNKERSFAISSALMRDLIQAGVHMAKYRDGCEL
ncbi:MAG: serine protease [archaeon]